MFVRAEISKIKFPKLIEPNEIVLNFRKLVFRYYLVFGACDLVLNEDVLMNKRLSG